MKVLLVEPRNCWVGLSIALGYIAASLKRAGVEVKVLDLTNHREWNEEKMLRTFVGEFKPDLIGMGIFYVSYFQVKAMVERIKKNYNCPMVIGGPHMLIEQEKILDDIPELDYAIIGDGEDTIVELCKTIEGKMSLRDVCGLIYRKEGKVIRNPDRAIAMDIDGIPFPDYDPFEVEKIKYYTIITSRGCPHSCTYCFRSTPKWRPRSPENIIEELKRAIKKYQIEEFVVVDDAFNIRPTRIIKFCDLLDEHNIKLPWKCTGVRADSMTESLAKRMKMAGCYEVNIGVETLDPELYKTLNRHMSIESIENCLKILQKYNFHVNGYFMIGLPGETKKKTWATYKKAKKMGINRPGFALMLPFPGTKMYHTIYSIPGVRKLEDYRRISTIWTYDPEFSRMKTAFDTPEYTATEKINMYNKVRTLEGDPRPPYHRNMLIFGLHACIWVFKYGPLHFPITFYKLFNNFMVRFKRSKGKHLYSLDTTYRHSFIKDMESKLERI